MFFRRKKIPTIEAEELHNWRDQNRDMIILDVRTEEEWKQTGIIPDSLTIPNFKLAAQMQQGLDLDKNKPVVVVCRTGTRSRKVTEFLLDQDIEAINLQNGILNWIRQQYEIESY